MKKIKKVHYYTMERSFFKGKIWKEHCGSEGAVPINTPQKVSYERAAPGVIPPPKPLAPSKEQLKIKQIEEAKQKAAIELQKKQQTSQPKQAETPKPKVLEAEDKEKLPEFDLQDIPNAMDNLKWPISAKFARKWFAGDSHIYNDKTDSVEPLDDNTVTLNWALKFGNLKNRLNELLFEDIYSEKALPIIQRKIIEHVTQLFTETKNPNPNLNFETSIIKSDIRQFILIGKCNRRKLACLTHGMEDF